MVVDVVIVNWNCGPELVSAVRSALVFGGRPIVVDNASTLGSLAEISAMDGVTVVRHERNLGFAAGCNSGAAAGTGEIVLLLNPDAEIVSGTAGDLDRAFASSGAMVLGPRLEHTSGRPLRSVHRVPRTTDLLHDLLRTRALRRRLRPATAAEAAGQPTTASPGWVVGSALAIRRTDWDRLRGMDDGYFLWYEDLDLAARATKAGGGVAMAPSILVRHVGASSWVHLSHRRRQWLRVRGAFRYANRHLGWAGAAQIVLAAPIAIGIGVAQDAVHALRRLA